MQVEELLDEPRRVSESLDRRELVPVGGFSIVDLERQGFSDLVGATADDEHEGSEEEGGVLISLDRIFAVLLVGGADPIPAAIAMAAQAPGIVEGGLVGGTAAEGDHHAIG